jgi:hypothetical protein
VVVLILHVRLALDAAQVLVQAVQQKVHQLLRILLLVAGKLLLEAADGALDI